MLGDHPAREPAIRGRPLEESAGPESVGTVALRATVATLSHAEAAEQSPHSCPPSADRGQSITFCAPTTRLHESEEDHPYNAGCGFAAAAIDLGVDGRPGDERAK